MEEVEHFENTGLPVMAPNSMNNYGVVLEELGFSTFYDQLLEYVRPVVRVLYGESAASLLDSHHAFIVSRNVAIFLLIDRSLKVQYKISEDLDLGFHYDESEITINLCLGKKFTGLSFFSLCRPLTFVEGGTLYFRGLLEVPETHNEDFEYTHTPGRAIMHIGKHRHGANAIKSGVSCSEVYILSNNPQERYNLIVWWRSNKLRQMEAEKRCSCCTSDDHIHDD